MMSELTPFHVYDEPLKEAEQGFVLARQMKSFYFAKLNSYLHNVMIFESSNIYRMGFYLAQYIKQTFPFLHRH